MHACARDARVKLFTYHPPIHVCGRFWKPERKEEYERTVELRKISVDKIRPNPFQPREKFEVESLRDLGDSMKDANIIQPIVVRRQKDGFQIIAGERRWRAARMVGLKEVPCIIKDVPKERVLLESLAENLHREDLTDIERENAIHELWENKDSFGFKTNADVARKLGVHPNYITRHLDAWNIRHQEHIDQRVSTDAIRVTRGLEAEERKRILDRVAEGDLGVREAYTTVKVLKRASKSLKDELLSAKPSITPNMAETIVEKLPNEEEQVIILEEVKRHRLTEDEIQDRVREIQKAKEDGKPLRKEMGVKEGIVYTVGEYECPHCKKHYLVKCNGKRDWVE